MPVLPFISLLVLSEDTVHKLALWYNLRIGSAPMAGMLDSSHDTQTRALEDLR